MSRYILPEHGMYGGADAMDLLPRTTPLGTCYSLTGLSSPWSGGTTYYPCNLTAVSLGQHSACCASGDTCLTNGLCKYNPPPPASPTDTIPPSNAYWRIGCTDPTYQDPVCPRQCRGKEGVERHVHIVFECPGSGNWCCGTGPISGYKQTLGVNTTCCDVQDLMFSEGEGSEGKAYTRATSVWAEEVATMTPVVVASGGTTTASGAATTTGEGTTASQGSTVVSGVATGTEGAASSQVSQDTESTGYASSKASPVAMGVGLGIGIPVLVFLALGVMFWYRARKRRSELGRPVELSSDTGRKQLHGYSVEKSGREVPVELSADTGPHEVWTPQDKRLGPERGSVVEMYR